ncbi:hypothetical protein [Acetivibrio ethanolgignens]|uniref:Uncharacterized protein n=1 Tax=Acetivibrio ethanolgignens TaxID=290052 RepID=A0A0V8QB21_9FIRM|nr:hypothetical protein [Acetivibrio ethanolgignens]KSV57735.1 hypothetical protein ASU35_15445 [Acetivibrio ethanolgignens]
MELRNIKTNKCPICGCTDVVSESVEIDTFNRVKVHCNGTRWEHRKFLCGKEICYEPNFCNESTHGDCINDTTYQALLKKQKEDKEKLLSFCEENGISKDMLRII